MRVGFVFGWLILLLAAAAAHEIPSDVTVTMFARPQGSVLRVLVRLPLRASLDAEYPRRERDFVDLAKAGPFLRDAARSALVRMISATKILMLTSWSDVSTPAELSIASVLMRPPARANAMRPFWVTPRFAPSPTTCAFTSSASTRRPSLALSPTSALVSARALI